MNVRLVTSPSTSSDSRHYDVAVVGAGLVGSACALAAAQQGLRVALIGPAESTALPLEIWDRRVYAISPSSKGFLDHLRLWAQLEPSRVGPVHEMHIHTGAGSAPDLTFADYEAGTSGLAWIVEHRELSRVVAAAVAYQHGIDRFAASVASIDVGTGTITSAVNAATWKATLIVGADGAQSMTRAAAGIAATVDDFHQTGIVCNFTAALPHGGRAYQWFTDLGVIALLPLPENVFSLVWSAPEALAKEILAEEPDALAARLSSWVATVAGTLTPLGGISGFPLQRLKTGAPIAPGVALIGDAAHVVHPLAGQGLNLGLQDAHQLVEVLARRETFRNCSDWRLLRRYARARKEAVWSMGELTDGLHRMFASADPMVTAVRKRGLKFVDRAPFVKGALIRRAIG